MAAAASLLPTPTQASTPRLLHRRRTNPFRRATSSPRPKKPPPLSCAAAATPAPAPAAASAKDGSWKDLYSLNTWVVRDYRRLVDSVGALEPALRRLSDEQLKGKTAELRAGRLSPTSRLAFAVAREAARRTLGMWHFDVQIIGGATTGMGSLSRARGFAVSL